MEIKDILKKAIDDQASDIFIVAGANLSFKINGHIVRQNEEILKPDDTRSLVEQIYALKNGINNKTINEVGEDDFSFALSNLGRFRVNVYYQRGSLAAVLRVVRFELPDYRDYHINDTVMNLANLTKGLVLVTGSAGSGKSTTLACLIDKINKERNGHIITIEDPIEYIHRHKNSIVSQRELFHDTKGYLEALRAALREAPDVILVGEMRDLETIQTVLQAAETGHLVLSTLHTIDATETINRIINVFPAEQQQQIRIQLSMVLQGVVSQQLIPTLDNKMHPAFEIMIINNAIRTQIRESKTHQIPNSIASGKNVGMISMDDSLLELYKNGIISKENALLYAANPDILAKKVL
ncbi:MAG: PilT/PilU family type 4a pilus ATPase [Erysipelotrichaceae bacterium]|nr:PilT/PilU family type 4a pilus ATPase [Erysipelotrichaceae bacterium]MDY5251194.1 PilT/PilU family type 4a pilus ATPase [Erysipelotrichaceae bacterium]